jgi:hypothetical protein
MSKKVKGDGMYFWKVYRLAGSTKEMVRKSNSIKVCRFCKKDEQTVSFKMDAHAFPELLGENDFVSHEECDACNSMFSGFESHLSKFFLPYLSVLQVKGKKKIPEFHSRTDNGGEITRTILKRGGDGRLQLIIGKDDDLLIDRETKKMSIRFRLPPHKPMYVYKALVKIGLSVLQSDLVEKYRSVFNWLMGEETKIAYFPMVYITKVVHHKFANPFAELYEANWIFKGKGFNPELTLIVNFGNLVAQIFLPLSSQFDYERSHRKSPQLEMYPASVLYNQNKDAYKDAKPTDLITINYQFSCVDLASEASCTRDEIIGFSFQDIETKENLETNVEIL